MRKFEERSEKNQRNFTRIRISNNYLSEKGKKGLSKHAKVNITFIKMHTSLSDHAHSGT